MSVKKRRRANRDGAWKDILDVYFKECMEFFFPDIYKKIDWAAGYIILDKELQSITSDAMVGKRSVDKLIKVKLLSGNEQTILLHLELQGEKEEEFPKRLFQYHYRLFDKYDESILTLALLTDDNKVWHPKNYQKQVCGISVITFNFLTCKLLDFRDKRKELEATINPFGLVVLAHLAAIETKKNPQSRYELKFSLTRRLYEQGHTKDYVINLFKMLDWVLVIPKELELEYKTKIHELEEAQNVSYITSIERLGREQGLQQGLQQGLEQGLQQGFQKGEHNKAINIAKNLLDEGLSIDLVKRVTQLAEIDLFALEKA